MTWEETIETIRTKEEYQDLVRDAYFDSNLRNNVERFRSSEEFKETLSVIKSLNLAGKVLVDVGSGNGISTIALALEGYTVHSIEPDPSNTIGAGAIRKLAGEYNVQSLVTVDQRYGEDTGLVDDLADVVYIRQAMHHADNLGAMMQECYRVLKPGGHLVTVRDHVIFDDKDKAWFLKSHPLHKFYGGENAFTEAEYRNAMTAAGFSIVKILKYYDSVINYFPLTKSEVDSLAKIKEQKLIAKLRRKVGPLAAIPLLQRLYKKYHRFNPATVYDERFVPGRMYSFLAIKE